MRALLMLLCAVSTSALADDEELFRFGVVGGMNRYTIEDPIGPTETGAGPTLGGMALLALGRDARAMFVLNRESFTLDGSRVNVGQRVTRTGATVSYQTLFRVSRTWKPWLGIGAGYASTDYKGRYVYTTEGNKTLYGSRSTSPFSVVVNASSDWQLSSDWDMGLTIQYQREIKDKASTVQAALYFVY